MNTTQKIYGITKLMNTCPIVHHDHQSAALRRMDPSYSAVEGEAYPFYSKRLKLKHF